MNNIILEFNDKNFEKKIKKLNLVLVDFWAEWCNPCKLFIPILKEILIKFNNKLFIAKLNIDMNPLITKKYNIINIPTLILFNKGSILSTKIGLLSKKQLEIFINTYL